MVPDQGDSKTQPLGTARGIFPGRVAWAHDPTAITYDPFHHGFDIDISHTPAPSPLPDGFFAPWPVREVDLPRLPLQGSKCKKRGLQQSVS